MLYNVASSFVKIDETQGIIQNASSGNSIEVSDEATTDSGIILKPGDSLSFNDTDIYVRTIGNKNSSVRVVPFVEGFSAGSSSDSDFDVRKYESAGILIYSKDAGGNLIEKPIHYVNPESTNAQLVAFGKSIVATTPNIYQATYRVTKSLCDPPDYSQYLIVDSPFNEDLTDNCSVVWNPAGTVSVSDGAANFNKTYLRSNEPVTFGGQDFTIRFYANMDSSSAGYCAPFSAAASLSNARLGEIDLRRDNTASSFSTEVFNGSGSFLGSVTLSNLIGALHHFELNYSHDDSALKYFIDGELKATQTCSIERLARYIFLGTNNYTLSASIVGTISHFQIYDGVAIHSENFTPE